MDTPQELLKVCLKHLLCPRLVSGWQHQQHKEFCCSYRIVVYSLRKYDSPSDLHHCQYHQMTNHWRHRCKKLPKSHPKLDHWNTHLRCSSKAIRRKGYIRTTRMKWWSNSHESNYNSTRFKWNEFHQWYFVIRPRAFIANANYLSIAAVFTRYYLICQTSLAASEKYFTTPEDALRTKMELMNRFINFLDKKCIWVRRLWCNYSGYVLTEDGYRLLLEAKGSNWSDVPGFCMESFPRKEK